MARFFPIFHVLSFELNFFFDRSFPLMTPNFQNISRSFSVHFCIFKDTSCCVKGRTYNGKRPLRLIDGSVGTL